MIQESGRLMKCNRAIPEPEGRPHPSLLKPGAGPAPKPPVNDPGLSLFWEVGAGVPLALREVPPMGTPPVPGPHPH